MTSASGSVVGMRERRPNLEHFVEAHQKLVISYTKWKFVHYVCTLHIGRYTRYILKNSNWIINKLELALWNTLQPPGIAKTLY